MKADLQPGDVLVFLADDRWISKLIAWGTFSDASHAAMVYAENQMVELGPDGIMVSRTHIGSGETAYQLRLSPAQDNAPLARAARRYVDEKICYDMPGLVLLGAVLIYRHIRPEAKILHLLDQVLALACVEADKLIKSLRRQPHAMVCSQFAYQVYQDCGADYALEIKGGVFCQAQDSQPRLIDLARQMPAASFKVSAEVSSEEDRQSLYQALYEALLRAEEAPAETISLPGTVSANVLGLHSLLEQLACAAGLPLDALLVTPADLAYHAQNLVRINQFAIERLERIQ